MKKYISIALVAALVLGCQSNGSRSSGVSQPVPPPITNNTAQAAPEPPKSSGFSFSRALDFVGFKKPTVESPSLVKPEILQIGTLVNTVVAKSQELSVNDPPEVTRQKASEILQALGSWDSMLASVRGAGLVNETTANELNRYVSQLRLHTQNLVQFAPSSETIGAVKQLAGVLKASVGGLGQIVGGGSSAFQAFLGNGQPAEQR